MTVYSARLLVSSDCQFSATVNVLTDPLSLINAMRCQAWEKYFPSKLVSEPVGDNSAVCLFIVCFLYIDSPEFLELVGWAQRVLITWLLENCFLFPLLMLHGLWWKQISVKRQSIYFVNLWSFPRKMRMTASICCLLLTETFSSFLFFFKKADYFYPQISSEASRRTVQFWWSYWRLGFSSFVLNVT